MKKTAAQVRTEINELYAKLNKIENAEQQAVGAPLVGKCYRYRNCYSSPKTDKDYWWLYIKILDIKEGYFTTLKFETDKDGEVRIKPHEISPVNPFLTSGNYKEIKPSTFKREWMKMLAKIARM